MQACIRRTGLLCPFRVRYNSTYKVSIATGNRRGASTSAEVFVQMIGSAAQTQRIPLLGKFVRNSTLNAEITTPIDLGTLEAVVVGHDSIGEVGVGWYLDQVDVQFNENHLTFPVQRWLGVSDIGAGTFPASIKLKVGIKHSMLDPTHESPAFTSPLWVRTGVAAFPHPDKVVAGEKAVVRHDIGQAGEDAYCVSAIVHPASEREALEAHCGYALDRKLPTTVTICVADGVYSWRNQGIDAGEWSRFLTRTVSHQSQYHIRDDTLPRDTMAPWYEQYQNLKIQTPTVPVYHPKQLMESAEAQIHLTSIKGSSTACIASIHGVDRMLYIANLGDSGVIVLRHKHGVVFRTNEQEHYLGCPYQLGHFEGADTAAAAQVSNLKLARGDLVVVASDGMFDNLNETEIEKVAHPYMELVRERIEHGTATKCAYDLAAAAFVNSVDKNKDTPYSIGAAEEFNLVWHGGKKDDITVVCAFVVN